MASFEPVDAPDGTAARPLTPDSRTTSASMVGLPRESRISRAMTSTIALMFLRSPVREVSCCAYADRIAYVDSQCRLGRVGHRELGKSRPLHGAIELHQRRKQVAHATQRPRVGSVGQRFRWIRMRLHEQACNAHRDS